MINDITSSQLLRFPISIILKLTSLAHDTLDKKVVLFNHLFDLFFCVHNQIDIQRNGFKIVDKLITSFQKSD